MYYSNINIDNADRWLGVDVGIPFDIDPLAGVDVDLATSQGYQQIGETVEGQSVGGVNRTIKGIFTGTNYLSAAQQASSMMYATHMFANGKLYFYNNQQRVFDDGYFCDFVIKKTPHIYTDKKGIIHFSILIFCPTPFWYKNKKNTYSVTNRTSKDCRNLGVAQMEFSIKFKTNTTLHDFRVDNISTGKYLALNTRLMPNETVTVYRKSGRLYVVKNDTEDIFSALDEGSNLFALNQGSNNLRLSSSTTSASLTADVEFYEPYMGVINATD